MKIFIFEQKLLISFGHWVKKVRYFPIFYEVVRTPFCMSKEFFGLENVLSIFFRGWPKKFQSTGGTFSKNLSKRHCVCPEERFGGVVLKKSLIILLHIEQKFFAISRIFFRNVLKNCIQYFYEKIFRTFIPIRNYRLFLSFLGTEQN